MLMKSNNLFLYDLFFSGNSSLNDKQVFPNVNVWGTWVKGIREFFVLYFKFSGKVKMISK